MKHVIKKRCVQRIDSFYQNVSRKYKNTYSEEMMHKNADEAFDAMYQIEVTLLRRKPTLDRWKGYHMANTDKWYYAYIFDGETVTVVDACHATTRSRPPVLGAFTVNLRWFPFFAVRR